MSNWVFVSCIYIVSTMLLLTMLSTVETKADPKSDLRLHEKQSFHVLRGASPSASQLDKRTGTSLSKPLPEYQEVSRSRTVRDLLRSLAEIHCLHAEVRGWKLD